MKLPLPCSSLTGHDGRFYSGHTPPLRRFAVDYCYFRPADHCRAPVTTPEATAVPVLALVFLSLLTSLADVTRRTLSSYVPGSRPGIVSGTILVPISASRTQKLWLTRRRKAFAVRRRLQGESLAGAFAPFMVELFMRRHFCQPPEPGQRSGPACRQVRNSPRKPRLNEHSAMHRSSNPLDGICRLPYWQSAHPL